MHKAILIDMDGCFVDFNEGFYQLAAREHPELVAHLPDRATQQLFYIDENIHDKAMAKLAESLVDHPELFAMLPPVKGAVDGMQYLRKTAKAAGFDVQICTAPHKQNKHSYWQKAQWIEDHLGFDWLNQTMIVRDKTLVSGTILLDDKPEPLGDHVPTWEHVLMDRPYNRRVTTKARFHDWNEVAVEMLVNHAIRRFEEYRYQMGRRGISV